MYESVFSVYNQLHKCKMVSLGFKTNARHRGYRVDTKKVNVVKINQEGLNGFEKETGRRKGQRQEVEDARHLQ